MRGILIVTMLVMSSTPALARQRTDKSTDPSRMICKTNDLIGSRLQQKRTCLTAMQWEEMRRDERNTVERVQQFKPVVGG